MNDTLLQWIHCSCKVVAVLITDADGWIDETSSKSGHYYVLVQSLTGRSSGLSQMSYVRLSPRLSTQSMYSATTQLDVCCSWHANNLSGPNPIQLPVPMQCSLKVREKCSFPLRRPPRQATHCMLQGTPHWHICTRAGKLDRIEASFLICMRLHF